MLGRGIDRILPHPGDPRIYERHAASAEDYVRLAERASGPIPRRVPPDYVWGEALSVIAAEHPAARIVNLETAVTTHSRPWDKGINYRMHPANIGVLLAARIDCCVLANNHVLDWGHEGLLETLRTLRNAGIRTAGAGCDANEAEAPAELSIGGGARALVFGCAAASSGVPREWAAGPDVPGVHLLPDLGPATAARLAETARRLRRPGDLAIASIHWGGNWGYQVPRQHRDFAHALVEGGFDLIHGHSSHHPMGVEVYRGRPILYGCGDLLNDYEGISGYEEFRPDLTALYFPRFDRTTGRWGSLGIVPMRVRRFRLNHAAPADAAWLHRILARESEKLGATLAARQDGSFAIECVGSDARG